MIRSFRTRGLQQFWERSDVERIPTDWAERISQILDMLDAAAAPEDLAIPGLEFRAYAEGRQPRFGVMVSRAWRLSFAWERGDAIAVSLEEIR
ncbi:MAG: type II toxin-antitoxin system RelE/ParE family toxin [Hyphomicrobiales bacterium]